MFKRSLAVAALLAVWFTAPFLLHADESENDPFFVSLTRSPSRPSQLPSNVSIITEDQIQTSGAQTLADALELIPAVTIARTGSIGTFTSLRMRGVTSAAQVQVLVDDQPLNGVSQQFLDLTQIPIDNIERIEVVRGGSSVLYGANTIGGVVHIITKKQIGKTPTVSAGFEAGSFKSKRATAQAGTSAGRWNGFATFHRFQTDGFMQNSDADQKAFTATSGVDLGKVSRLTADVSHVDHKVGTAQGTSIPIGEWDGTKERTAANPTGRSEQRKTDGRLRWDAPLLAGGLLQSTLFGSRQNYLTRTRVGAAPGFQQLNKIIGNDTRCLLPHQWTIGASYERDERRNEGDNPHHVVNVGGYLQKEWGRDKFKFIPAVRADHHSAFGSVINPRLTGVLALTDWWSVSSNIARSFRAPSFLELYYQSSFFNGNPNLKPETAWTYDLGNQFKLGADQTLRVTGTFTRIKNRIAATMTTYENVSQVETSGAEVELSGSMDAGRLGRFGERMSYTIQRSLANSMASSKFVPLRLTPRHKGTAELTWTKSGWSLSNAVHYVSDQFQFDNYVGGRLPPYAVWNAHLRKTLGVAEFSLSVDNILNRRYAEAFDYDPTTFATTFDPQPTRTYWGGVSVKFAGR